MDHLGFVSPVGAENAIHALTSDSLQVRLDREIGPWPSRSSISPSSGPCRSSVYRGVTTPIWSSGSSCSTRWLSSSTLGHVGSHP